MMSGLLLNACPVRAPGLPVPVFAVATGLECEPLFSSFQHGFKTMVILVEVSMHVTDVLTRVNCSVTPVTWRRKPHAILNRLKVLMALSGDDLQPKT